MRINKKNYKQLAPGSILDSVVPVAVEGGLELFKMAIEGIRQAMANGGNKAKRIRALEEIVVRQSQEIEALKDEVNLLTEIVTKP